MINTEVQEYIVVGWYSFKSGAVKYAIFMVTTCGKRYPYFENGKAVEFFLEVEANIKCGVLNKKIK